MNFIALKMLVGDKAKYLGIIMGLTFASLLITQQLAIFVGLMTRTFGTVTDISLPDIWVMDPKVQYIDDIKAMQDTVLYRVRGMEGVQWAMPLYKGMIKAKLPDGTYQNCNVFGLDDATLVGGPPVMVEGRLEDLRRAEGVIVDEASAIAPNGKLKKRNPDGTEERLRIGDTIELNDNRAVVVGICRVTRTFQSQPVIYTTYSRATTFAPRERKLLSFVLVKAKPGIAPEALAEQITQSSLDSRGKPTLVAYTGDQFGWNTVQYYMNNTGIPINFGIAVVLGFVVGTAIAGQTFYNFTLDNLRHFGALKAMGSPNGTLLRMILLQSVVVGLIGYGLGVGLAALMGFMARNSELAFRLPWQLLAFTGGAVTLICILSALISIRTVMRLEPAIVFKG